MAKEDAILGRVLTEIDLVRHLGARSLIERKARLAALLSPPSRRRS
jgi:hypothetical protein